MEIGAGGRPKGRPVHFLFFGHVGGRSGAKVELVAQVPPLRGPTRHKTARRENRAAPVWMTENAKSRSGDRRTLGKGSGAVGYAAFAGGVGAEDAVEEFVDVAKLALEVEGVFEILGREKFCDAGIFGDAIAETGFGFPGGHGVFLDGFVGVVAGHAFFDEVLKELSGEDEAVGGFEIAEHAIGEDAHLADELGHFGEHVVHEDGGIGENDALDAAVRDVAFVPKGDVFVGSEHVAADEAGEAADLFSGDGIALVGHGGTAALLATEMFLGFADFGALEMANFEGDFFEARRR